MCNFSNFSNNNQSNQSATYNPLDNQQAKTPTALELIKMAAELAAIDHAADSMIYNPIPISVSLNAKVGDVNISCSINNDAARGNIDCNCSSMYKQATGQTTQQESKADHQQESKADNQQESKADNHKQRTTNNASKTTDHLKFDELYSLITDFIGSYTKTKISIAPGCSDSIRLGFINKGESVEKTKMPFFGVETISMQRHFSKVFESFSIFPKGDAFSVTIKGDEVAVSNLMRRVQDNIVRNGRNVEWARYNN